MAQLLAGSTVGGKEIATLSEDGKIPVEQIPDANPYFVIGSYPGSDGTSIIDVGFTPSRVFVSSQAGTSLRTFYAFPGKAYYHYVASSSNTANETTTIEIVENGFKVVANTGSSSANSKYRVYEYIAYK